MFKKLNNNIDKATFCEAWYDGNEFRNVGILKKVNYYNRIIFGEYSIPFIGYLSAIKRITLCEKGEVLYYNPYAESFYIGATIEEIEGLKAKTYGDEIMFKQKNRRINYEKNSKRGLELFNKKAQLKRGYLKKKSIPFIKKELLDEWSKYIDANTKSAYSCHFLEFVIDCIIAVNKCAPNDVEKVIADVIVDNDINYHVASCIRAAVAYFSRDTIIVTRDHDPVLKLN